MLNTSLIEPADLAKLTAAFEDAWGMVEAEKRVSLMHALTERDRLGHIVLALWQADKECDLAAQAVAQFFATAGPLAPVPNLNKPLDF